jgi:hypothetical protein
LTRRPALQDGRSYFYNPATNRTSWTRGEISPAATTPAAPAVAAAKATAAAAVAGATTAPAAAAQAGLSLASVQEAAGP